MRSVVRILLPWLLLSGLAGCWTDEKTIYAAHVPYSAENLDEVRQLFRWAARPGENDWTDVSEELTQGSGIQSVYVGVLAKEDTTLLAVNVPDRSQIEVSVIGRDAPGYLPEFIRRVDQIRSADAG